MASVSFNPVANLAQLGSGTTRSRSESPGSSGTAGSSGIAENAETSPADAAAASAATQPEPIANITRSGLFGEAPSIDTPGGSNTLKVGSDLGSSSGTGARDLETEAPSASVQNGEAVPGVDVSRGARLDIVS